VLGKSNEELTKLNIFVCLVFSAFTVKVTLPEKVMVMKFEWTLKQITTESLSAGSSSSLLSALLDPDTSDSLSSARIVRRKYRVGHSVLAYLQSHSAVLATICGLLSCRKSRPTSEHNSGQEEPAENCTIYYRRRRKNVECDGCTFVREVEIPCKFTYGSARRRRAGVTLDIPAAAASIDENLRDYIFRKLKHQLPTLRRFLVQFLSPLMPGSEDPTSDPFWLLCSREIPDDLCAVLPSLFADRYFTQHVYRHISQLLQIHCLQSVGFGKFLTEPKCRSVEEILQLFEVVPSSVVRRSILWGVLHDFVVISAVRGGFLTSAHALRVHDPGGRCRLLLSTTTQGDTSESLSFSDMLKSCLSDGECPELKQVVEKRIVTEKLHSEVTYIYVS